jgi:EAL domain-containing protein (putative c-di-GMP-specific phosphodiesterase class I)
MVYIGAMALAKRSRTKPAAVKHVRRSVTLPPKIAKQVETLAKRHALSDNRVLLELIEQGIEARQQKEKAFFQLAERFRAADDPAQVKQLGDQLGRFVFGE